VRKVELPQESAQRPRRGQHDHNVKNQSWGRKCDLGSQIFWPLASILATCAMGLAFRKCIFLERPREDRNRPAGPAAGGAPPPRGDIASKGFAVARSHRSIFRSWEARIMLRNPPWARGAPRGHLYWGANTHPPPTLPHNSVNAANQL
jgi:hypothetical protein